MIFLYCMAQHDSSCNRLKSGSSLNSSWRIMIFQPELLNNTLYRPSQQEAPCTTKPTLANPIISNFQKGPFCKGPGKVRHASFLLLIKMLFYSQFPPLTDDILVAFYNFFFQNNIFPWLQYFQRERNASESEVTFISLLSCWSQAGYYGDLVK